jgi:primosomal protein N' (replication factor Y)
MPASSYTNGMYYYEVLVGDMQYHGNDALTYSSEQALGIGVVVRVTLRSRAVLAVVVRKVSKPAFAAKPIAAVAPAKPVPTQTLELIDWMREYYPAPLGAIVRQFLPPSNAFPKEPDEQPSTALAATDLPPLTEQQQAALDTITGAGSFLLHGITGSGKSRVYLELVRRSLVAGRSAVILTPEIGLTAQLVKTFHAQFGSNVFVLHSQLTAAQRRDIWYELLNRAEPAVVIGPRSALFSPIGNIGLIVIDEAHDQAYKNESAPNYQAGRVAAKLAMLHGASFVSGSATPAIEDYYLAEAKQRPIVVMNSLAASNDASEVKMHVIDLREHDNFTRSRLLSGQLLDAVTAALSRGEQSLLFLNRRGTANIVLCQNCGWQPHCPNCDTAVAYHGDAHELRCHVCGYHAPFPLSCPECGNTEILLKSIGTKAVMTEVERLFPQARSQRFDTDIHKSERLEQHMEALVDGTTDIIVGTQIVGKGLDLPRLSVVGVINSDSSLFIPDYTATERTYQLISQVIGRVGRGHRKSSVIVQSYNPDHPTLQAALQRDWQGFYKQELDERKLFHFPPFTYLLQLRVLRATEASARQAATTLANDLHTRFPRIGVEGPTPAFHPKVNGKHNWQIIIRSTNRPLLARIARELPSGWHYDIDPINLL